MSYKYKDCGARLRLCYVNKKPIIDLIEKNIFISNQTAKVNTQNP